MSIAVQTVPSFLLAGSTPVQLTGNGGTSGYVLTSDGSGHWSMAAASSGSGTVTSVSVVTANGVSGSVANPTTTPAISFTLSAITPTTIVASSTISGSNLSGTNSGDVTLANSGYLSISGQAITMAQVNLASQVTGTLPAANLPNPATNALGGIQAINAVSHEWINSISTSGVPSLTQPAFTDISGSIAAAQLPNPSATTLGGIQSFASQSHKYLTSISTSGVPAAAQPSSADLSDGVTGSGGAVVLATGPTLSNPIVGTQTSTDNSNLAASTAFVTTAINSVLANSTNKAACDLIAESVLPTNVYNNGSSGVGATLTGVSTGVLTIDGTAATSGLSILVNGEATQGNNGIYTVTVAGAVGTAYVLTRRSDYNVAADITAGDTVYIRSGTTYQKTTWTMITAGAITVGTTAIVFTQTAGVGTYVNGTGLSLTGSTFNVNASQTQVTGVGTLTAGTWNAGVIAPTYGGTGLATLTANAVMLGNGTGNVGFATIGTAGRILIDQGASTNPAFTAVSGSGATFTLSNAGLLTVSAIANASLTNSSVTLNSHTLSLGGTLTLAVADITGAAPLASPAFTGTVTLGTLGYSDTGILESLQSSTNSYNQLIIQNTSSGSTASSDVIVNNNNSTSTTYYGDFGMNSSGFTGSGSLNLANAVYLAATSGELVLGTTTSNGIRCVVNNGTTDALAINSSGNATFSGTVTNSQSIGITSTDGIVSLAGTAATVSLNQWSVRDRKTGFGWMTNTPASWQVDYISELQTFTGLSAPTGKLTWSSRVSSAGSGSFVSQMTLDTSGNLVTTGTLAGSNFTTTSSDVSIGPSVTIGGSSNVAVGGSANVNGSSNVVVGYSAACNTNGSGGYNTAVGTYVAIPGGVSGSVVIGGAGAIASGTSYGIALGYQAATTLSNQFVVGSSGAPVYYSYLGGNGVSNASPAGYNICSTSGSGTNIGGSGFALSPGTSTGTGAAGTVAILGGFAGLSQNATVTLTVATPCVVTYTSHGFNSGQAIKFTTTGALPTGITSGSTYYVIATGMAVNTFQFSATVGGSAVATTGTQSGTQTCTALTNVSNPASTIATWGPCSLGGSQTTSLLAMSQFWNTTGNVNGLQFSVTNVASGSSSNILALQNGVTNVFAVSPTGLTTLSPTTGIAAYVTGGAIETAVYSNGNSGTSLALNLDNGNKQSVTITGAVTITMTSPTHPGSFTIAVTQDGTGHTYSFSGVKWAAGTQPTWSAAASAIDIVSFYYDGSHWFGTGGTAFA